MVAKAFPNRCSIGDFLEWLAPSYVDSDIPPKWPPDLFAICSTLLAQTGGYRHVAQDWPPKPSGGRKQNWEAWINKLGTDWQRGFEAGEVPAKVSTWWQQLLKKRDLDIALLGKDRGLCLVLIQLSAVADNACSLLDIAPAELTGSAGAMANQFERFLDCSSDQDTGVTLCNPAVISPSRVRVLPRCRTPQRGLTLRSLTHYLALVRGNEVTPRWHWVPSLKTSQRSQLNLLLAPWPLVVERSSFRPAPSARGQVRNLAPEYRFFDFNPRIGSKSRKITEWLDSLLREACREAESIDLVILPELALHPTEEPDVLEWAQKRGVAIIAGVGFSGDGDSLGANYVVLGFPFVGGTFVTVRQDKHHRWLLDRNQIEAYGLGGFLDPNFFWWEPIGVVQRCLELVTLRTDLTICALVCEDLTQQEPVSDLIRAVGPNLVVAVLMDGPQLGTRWPARYAGVLADDPGCSVLTLTSLGMCQRSQPFGMQASRAIGMWRDGSSGKSRELVLGARAEGMVLNLVIEKRREYSADGRRDKGTAACPIFVGSFDVIPVKP